MSDDPLDFFRDAAAAHYQRALTIMEGALGPEHPDVASTLHNMGTLSYMRLHRLEEALTYCRRALAIREQALGPRHPLVASSISTIGLVLADQGELPEAQAHHERALDETALAGSCAHGLGCSPAGEAAACVAKSCGSMDFRIASAMIACPFALG